MSIQRRVKIEVKHYLKTPCIIITAPPRISNVSPFPPTDTTPSSARAPRNSRAESGAQELIIYLPAEIMTRLNYLSRLNYRRPPQLPTFPGDIFRCDADCGSLHPPVCTEEVVRRPDCQYLGPSASDACAG
ncbi:hypothetical protein CDAR_29711 [Caerostris darwini]|uniref:Uncharacterized protein n=1 Tax=Caerostris darwini TaxID=1538125 RepID=A0AAV4QQA5_9ARAC|nr:hypothetical protein CDAR_29711 [Caerostris darwini]